MLVLVNVAIVLSPVTEINFILFYVYFLKILFINF